MVFSVTSFINSVQIVRPNLFIAYLRVPANLQAAMALASSNGAIGSLASSKSKWTQSVNFTSGTTAEQFSFRCEAAELPGRTINGIDVDEAGPSFKIATDTVYNDISLTIIASKDMQERKLFESWMEYMVGNDGNAGGVTGRGGLSKYYNDYVGKLELYQLDDYGNQIAGYKLHNAYPISLGSMSANWEERDTYQRFSVTMSYRHHTVDF